MYYIIGTYRKKNRIAALKLFNPETKEIRMDHKSVVFGNAESGKEVYIGVEKKVNSYGEEVMDTTRRGINVRCLDEVDEKGNPIDDRHARLVLSIKGYGSSMEALVIDSMGKLETICYNEFIRLLDEKRIVGAKRIAFDGIEYHKHLIKEGLILSNN